MRIHCAACCDDNLETAPRTVRRCASQVKADRTMTAHLLLRRSSSKSWIKNNSVLTSIVRCNIIFGRLHPKTSARRLTANSDHVESRSACCARARSPVTVMKRPSHVEQLRAFGIYHSQQVLRPMPAYLKGPQETRRCAARALVHPDNDI
jgi:hypothetical protein